MRRGWLPGDAPLEGIALAAWRAHRDAVVEGRRHDAAPTLAAFLEAFGREPAERGERFCRWLCVWAFERRSCDLRYPFVRDVVLPYLVGGIRDGGTPHLRWLATLRFQALDLVRGAEPALADFEALPSATLLRAALVVDPRDRLAWQLLFDEHLDVAAWGAHHLDADELVLPLEQCLGALADATRIRAALPPGWLDDDQLGDHDELEAVFAAWRGWLEAGRPGRFYEWTDARPSWSPSHRPF